MVDAGFAERVTAGLRHDGVVVVEDALPSSVLAGLLGSLLRRHGEEFDRAGVGRAADHRKRPAVRGDLISWLRGDDDPTRWYLSWSEQLRRELNRQLFLGLFEFECHFAWYQVGASYARHVDAFRGESTRIVSSVLYLNPAWRPADAGELVLYAPPEPEDGDAQLVVACIVPPRFGTVVLFLSEEFPHEVLPAAAPRASIAGWYRVNGSSSNRADPPPG